MPLEAMAALAVASGVITFVDFARKLISTGIELYQTGNLVEYTELKAAAEMLTGLRDTMLNQQKSIGMRQLDLKGWNAPISRASLVEAQGHCIECADEVIKAIRKMKVSGPQRKWESFSCALSGVLGHQNLEAMAKRLSDARQQFILLLLLHQEYVQRSFSLETLKGTKDRKIFLTGP